MDNRSKFQSFINYAQMVLWNSVDKVSSLLEYTTNKAE